MENLDNYREQVNNRIKALLGRKTLAENLREQNEKQVARKHSWMDDVRADKATYIFMGVSAVFTALLGIILGLAPEKNTQLDGSVTIFFHTDLLHLAMALVYATAFVTVTEYAFIMAKNKFHTREEGNFTQSIAMFLMMILSVVSIIGTGWAGGKIGASVLGFLTDFEEIPHNAQSWVVSVIPVLVGIYGVLLVVYRLSSNAAKNRRLMDDAKRAQEEDHELRMAMVELDEEEQLQLVEIESYKKAVADGRLTAAEAMAARRAQKTLRQLESEKGRDLNGDGVIEQPVPVGFSNNGKNKPDF